MQDLIVPIRGIDDTFKGSDVEHWAHTVMTAAEKSGKNWKNSANYARYFEEAGFVDVVERHFQWPMNSWPKGDRLKLMGSYFMKDMVSGIEGLSMAILTRAAGMSKEQVLELTAKAKVGLQDKRIHAYCPM